MSAFDNYLRITSFLDDYLCKEMLLAVPYPLPSGEAPGYSAPAPAKHAFFKDVIYEAPRASGFAKATPDRCPWYLLARLRYASPRHPCVSGGEIRRSASRIPPRTRPGSPAKPDECSSEEVTKMFCRTLNIRELAFIAERIEGYLIENGY
jgi:hypothetical protein